jgi:primosomal protein N'
MFECSECHQPTAKYDNKEKIFECKTCGAMYIVPRELRYCPRCGYAHFSYTWFDPAYCPECNYSFVD